MKIYNVSSKKIIGIAILVLILIVLLSIAINLIKSTVAIEMTTDNYTNILKDCHKNPYNYVDKKIKTSGYIYRNADFSESQFVIARDMLINKNESQVVGFLCEYEDIKEFENNVWVCAEGTISIGDYYGAIPIIKVSHIQRITTPNDTFVNLPSDE